jgi:hypothetical protein
MSQTFRRDPDASPFATRRAAFKRSDKRDTFEARREARQLTPRAQALASLDDAPDARSL